MSDAQDQEQVVVRRMKMIVGGVCNFVVLVTFALLVVVLSESQLVHKVLAATVTELNSDRILLPTEGAGSYVGKKEPVLEDDPIEIQRTYFAFRGIPYASPPLGELRWQPPQPVELKSKPHQAAKFKPPCSQWSPTKKKVVGAPDCLYLNVFTPFIPAASKRRISGNVTSWTVENQNLLPVLVYVHGGEFISGNASKYSPDALMKRERVVLVTFNFRLGVLGFLSTGNDDLPGNYGLLDQIAVLKWVKKYIHRFGGNHYRVTIFGSVEYLLVANDLPGNEDLFHSAILKPQSTSILSPFAKFGSQEGAKNFMRQLADHAGCKDLESSSSNDRNVEVIDCLRKADTDTLIRSQMKMMTFHNFPFGQHEASLGPVVDNILLDDEPEVLFSSGKFRDVPIMVGLSSNEGFNPFLEFYLKLSRKNAGQPGSSPEDTTGKNNNKQKSLDNVLNEHDVKSMLHSVMQTVMAGIPDIEKNGAFERVFHSIWNYYFGGINSKSWHKEMDHVVQKLFRLFGDMLVNTGHCKMLQALSSKSKEPVFAYVFSHGTSNFLEFFKNSRQMFEGSELMMGPKRPKRSLHMTLDAPWEEPYYLFHPLQESDNDTQILYNRGEELSEGDKQISDALAKIWVSFAKYGQPKQAMAELPEFGRWTRMENGHKSMSYFLISNVPLQIGMRSDFKKAECQFWMNTVPQVRRLSKRIQDLEPFPVLFWSSVAVIVLFTLIIITLIVLILWAKHRQGSYGRGEGIYLHHARQL